MLLRITSESHQLRNNRSTTDRGQNTDRGEMGTTHQYFNLVRTSKSTWVAVHVNPDEGSMFAQTAAAPASFTERFPRLTIAVIALALFAVSATFEVEWLRHAGYVWR